MDLKKQYKNKKQALDDYTFHHSLWKRFEGRELDENQCNFLSLCMTENLEHARHVENERLTFNSIFLALVAGAMAFADNLHPTIAFGIYLFMTIAGFLSMVLTTRWNNAFDRHLFYAQKCYKLLHINLFGKVEAEDEDWETPESIEFLNEMPMYCFRINRPIAYTKLGELMYKPRTRQLYMLFYWIIQVLLIACTIMELLKLL